MTEPVYWKNLNWTAGWGGNLPLKEAAAALRSDLRGRHAIDSVKGLDVLPQNVVELITSFRGLSNFQTAKLDPASVEFKTIARYLEANAASRTMRPPQGERTRMVRAKGEILKLTAGELDAVSLAKLKTHLRTLREAPKYITEDIREHYAVHDIPIRKTAPTASAQVAISKIRAVRHPALWEAYKNKRALIAAEIASSDKPALTTGGKVYGREKVVFTTLADSGLSGEGPPLPVLDTQAGEVLLMHGTSPEVIKVITEKGFDPTFNKGTTDPRTGVTKYGALGQGSYFGDSFAKVQTYIGCPLCSALQCSCIGKDGLPKERMVLLSRCLLGVPTKARNHSSHRAHDASNIKAGKHSVIGQEWGWNSATLFGSNEFMLKDKDQVYPEFVVYWRRA